LGNIPDTKKNPPKPHKKPETNKREEKLKTLFLNPPVVERYDSAGARFQAKRKTKSMWYPTWLCYAAGLIENSEVIDCPARGISTEELLYKIESEHYDLIVIQTSTPSLKNDFKSR